MTNTRSRSSYPNNLDNRPRFSLLKTPPKRKYYDAEHHLPATVGHPTVFIPQLSYAPPGLSTEFVWECEYDKIPETFFASHFPPKREPLYSPRRETALSLGPVRDSKLFGGKRHFVPQNDHVGSLMSLDHNLEPTHFHRNASETEQEIPSVDPVEVGGGLDTREAGENSDVDRLNNLKRMWKGVKEGVVSVSALKAEMNQLREETEDKFQRELMFHRDKVTQHGYGRISKGQMHEPLHDSQFSRSNVGLGDDWQEHLHHMRVADIGYGRVARGAMAEPVKVIGYE